MSWRIERLVGVVKEGNYRWGDVDMVLILKEVAAETSLPIIGRSCALAIILADI